MTRVLIILSLLLATAMSGLAQDSINWPPDGARLLGLDPVVPFRWEGDRRSRYLVQIYASDKEILTKEVQGNSLSVELWPGSYYRWQVARVEKGGSYSLVPTRSFTLSSEVEFSFTGKSGRNGKDGVSSQDFGRRGGDGTNGENGGDGPRVSVVLEPAIEDVLYLAVTGPSTTQSYFLLPGTPIYVTTRGGDGGNGGNGGHGGPGLFYIQANRNFQESASFPPGIGGDGGIGGEGGHGGTVTVRTAGVARPPTIHVDNAGGRGGRGGAAGAGGAAPIIPNFYQGWIPPVYQGAAPPGRPGPNGAPGEQGPVYSP